jgi:hypothetical protein
MVAHKQKLVCIFSMYVEGNYKMCWAWANQVSTGQLQRTYLDAAAARGVLPTYQPWKCQGIVTKVRKTIIAS